MKLQPLALSFFVFATLSFSADSSTNCPAAFRPYSAGTPLLDLLINPATKAVIERDAPGFLSRMPKVLVGDTPPTLADVLTIKVMAEEFGAFSKDAVEKLDKDLAAIPVTHDDAVARCKRYDQTPPALPKEIAHPAILVFSKSNGFKDVPSVNGAVAALKEMSERRHWNLVLEDNAAVFNAKQLKRFDAVLWNNVSGDVLTIPQRAAFKAYIEKGGGFAALHGSGGDPYTDWDWYADTSSALRFLSHPMSPQFQNAKVRVDDPKSPITQNLQPEWTMQDEWYSFRSNPRKNGSHVFADTG